MMIALLLTILYSDSEQTDDFRGMFISKLIITIFRSFIVKLAIPGILLLMLVNHQIGTVLHNG